LAERGVQVVATDSSSQMIDVTTQRARENARQNLIQPLLLPAEQIATLRTDELFDGAFSNFGALNCVEDLRQLAEDLAMLLKPGAEALLCLMGARCLWEMFWYSAQGNKSKAFRRLNHDGVTAKIADGALIRVRYPLVRSLARTFAPDFQLKSIKGVGVVVPP